LRRASRLKAVSYVIKQCEAVSKDELVHLFGVCFGLRVFSFWCVASMTL
jgi:hypothetical protein